MFNTVPIVARQEWDKTKGLPSFKLRVLTGFGFMQTASRMPYALAEQGQTELKLKRITASIIYDPE